MANIYEINKLKQANFNSFKSFDNCLVATNNNCIYVIDSGIIQSYNVISNEMNILNNDLNWLISSTYYYSGSTVVMNKLLLIPYVTLSYSSKNLAIYYYNIEENTFTKKTYPLSFTKGYGYTNFIFTIMKKNESQCKIYITSSYYYNNNNLWTIECDLNIDTDEFAIVQNKIVYNGSEYGKLMKWGIPSNPNSDDMCSNINNTSNFNPSLSVIPISTEYSTYGYYGNLIGSNSVTSCNGTNKYGFNPNTYFGDTYKKLRYYNAVHAIVNNKEAIIIGGYGGDLTAKPYVISLNLNNGVSTLISTIDTNGLDTTNMNGWALDSFTNNLYILIGSKPTFIYQIKIISYELAYTFKQASDTILELNDQFPIKIITIKVKDSVVTTTLTFIDDSTQDVVVTLNQGEIFTGWLIQGENYTFKAVQGINSINVNENATFTFQTTSSKPTTEKMNLFQSSAEPIRVDKTNYLTEYGTLNGVLRESSSIFNPTITFEWAGTPKFNYIYIEKWNRYYFVKDITSIKNNLWQMELNCDVLMSFKDGILDLDTIVERQEFEQNKYLIDSNIPTQVNNLVEVEVVEDSPFSTSDPTGDMGKSYVLTVIGGDK